MRIVKVYVMDKQVAEFPDCRIVYDGSWVYVVPSGATSEWNENVCRFIRESKRISVIETEQEEQK
jgi:hypothetical protein